MEFNLGSRLKRAWDVFRNANDYRPPSGAGYSYRPDRIRLTRGNERSLTSSIYNRIALDCAAISIKHVKLDDNDRYSDEIRSGLDECLTLAANSDQTSRSFIQDVVLSMLDEGCVAIVPTDTSDNPMIREDYDIFSMRVGKVIDWFPNEVRVELFNEEKNLKECLLLPKKMVAIVENPMYAVINEPNSTMQRLVRKLNLLDIVDEQSSSGKLDLIIQLPYVIKTESRKRQAEARRKDIEDQLSGSKYGIAYTDGTEKITQLNRSLENNLLAQIEYLTRMLYGQLGLTENVMNGSADEKEMLNYTNRTIEPIVSAIVDSMRWKFLSREARTQRKETIMFFRDPFRLVPVENIAEIADKFTRNEIMSSNEIRQIVGMRPSSDPRADELRNKNLNESAETEAQKPTIETEEENENVRSE